MYLFELRVFSRYILFIQNRNDMCLGESLTCSFVYGILYVSFVSLLHAYDIFKGCIQNSEEASLVLKSDLIQKNNNVGGKMLGVHG